MSSHEDQSDSAAVADGIPAIEEADEGAVAKALPVVAPFDTDAGTSATRLGLGEAFRRVRWKPILATAAAFVVGFGAGFVARSPTAPATGAIPSLDWSGSSHLQDNLNAVVRSNSYCERRKAITAETAEVKVGADNGLLLFVPAKLSICTGDSIKWINNRAGPHNVVFDEFDIPAGVDYESISMIDEELAEEGDVFVVKFTVAGLYEYYCEPHRGAGMSGTIYVGGR